MTLGSVARDEVGSPFVSSKQEESKNETRMAHAKDASIERDQQKSARPVSPKTGEISNADLEEVAGGTEDVVFEYGGMEVRYTPQ